MAAIYYLVKAKFIRNKKENNEFDFVEFEEKFEDENPIIARNKAFDYYQNYIDVLLESKGSMYHTHEQAEKELKSFIKTNIISYHTFKIGDSEMEFEWSIDDDLGIGIFWVKNETLFEKELKFSTEEQIRRGDFIHGIGSFYTFYRGNATLMLDLEEEYEAYNELGYDTDGQEIQVLFCNEDEWAEGYLGNGEWVDGYEEPNWHTILKTPFDWTGLDIVDEPKEGENRITVSNSEDEDEGNLPKLTELIKNGESNQLEFKPTLLYNFKTKQGAIGVKAIIAKAICAFLNSNGGYLLIGVNDDTTIEGLEYDYSLFNGENGSDEKDFFNLEFDQMLNHFFPKSVLSNIKGTIIPLNNGKEIFAVTVFPSKHQPIFMNGQNGKEFYVRSTASSRQIIDIEEIVSYCFEKWKN